jgi:hypothetical protein
MSNHNSNKNRTTTGTSQPSLILGDLREHDVLLGRGTGPNENRGNKHFRDLLNKYKQVYSESDTRMAKADVVWHTIREVKMKHGRFVEKVAGRNPRDGGGAVYKEVEDNVAFIKTRQAFRYALRNLNDHDGPQEQTFPPKKQAFPPKKQVFSEEEPTQKNNMMMRADHISSFNLSPLSSMEQRQTLPHDPRFELLNMMDRLKARDMALARHHTALATMPSNFLNMSAFRNPGLELGPLFPTLPRGDPNTALRLLVEESLAASRSQLLLDPYAASLSSSPRLLPKQLTVAPAPLEDLVLESMATRMALRRLSHST